ncbi:hypothetical protein [Paenibacillus sp. Soil522]|uniref:hypothetical protein n=1 Tax=Paenibacillus sp. Soil522 TaxID=1736388 RepID=UPI00070049C2|nr:hypothetical protein [Paenibacillus sp. Soil522]KRE39726.1 hypothetical protein ASG81_19270 [Paenibacillus sp. Soil522]
MKYEYRTPLLLERIINWEREFACEVEYLEKPTGLFLGIDFNEKEGYFCTPIDSFSFARTGGDGLHYVLLTDFGLVKDLNEAPVIRISPMDTESIRLVAPNLSDFFSLHFFDELLLLNEYKSEEAYLESIREEEANDLNSEWFDHDRWKREKAMVVNEVQEKFNLSPIPNAFQYLQDIRFERQLQISISTEDSLGILPLTPVISPDNEAMLASIRNLQFSACSNRVLVESHANELIQLGMTNEAESLLTRLLR